MADQVKVLIVDTSRIFRSALEESLSREDDIWVVGTVRNGETALDFIQRTPPDVVVFDVEVPDVLEALGRIQGFNTANPDVPDIGVVLVAGGAGSNADITIKALEAGAFDFVTKPDLGDTDAIIKALSRQLLVKLLHFSSKRIFSSISMRFGLDRVVPAQPPEIKKTPERPGMKAILIGVSTGGPKVLAGLIPEISKSVTLPIFIVQHMPSNFTASLAHSLDAKCGHKVAEAQGIEPIRDRSVYIAPGGKQMLIRKGAARQICVAVTDDPPEDGCRPSVNVLFRSAAKIFGGDVITLVLTGMGSDGLKGLEDLKKAGAYVIAQDEASSVVWGMPGNAVSSGCVDKVLSPEEIPGEILSIVKGL